MQGKVTICPAACYNCGRQRLTIAQAPWGQVVLICTACKQLEPLESMHGMITTPEEAAERGLPKSRGPAQTGPWPPFDGQEPEPEPEPAVCAPVPPEPEPIPQRSRRRSGGATD